MTVKLYILRQVVLALTFAVGGMLLIAVPGMAVSAIHRLGGAFIGPILGFIPLEFVPLVPYILPIGYLLSVVSTYGRLAADNEWTAMCMAGFHPAGLLAPGLLVAAVLGASTWYMETEVAPPMSLKKRDYLRSAAVSSFRSLAPGRTQFRFGEGYLSSRFREGDEFREVVIHVPGRGDEEAQTILAEHLRVEMTEHEARFFLRDYQHIHTGRDARGGALEIVVPLDSLFGTGKARRARIKDRTSPQLRALLAGDELTLKEQRRARYLLHHRNSRLVTCLMFLLLGAPTGLYLRRGTQLGALAVSVVFALVYFLLTLRVGKVMAEAGTVPAWLGAWSSTLLGGVAGLWMTWRILRK